MKFDYQKQPVLDDPGKSWIARPYIPVELSHEGKNVRVYALIDSGADTSLFHSSLGRELGIDVESGRKSSFFGIAEGPGVNVYIHTILVQVVGDDTPIDMEVGFTDSKGVGAILGQSGFFDHYIVRFDRSKNRLEVAPSKR